MVKIIRFIGFLIVCFGLASIIYVANNKDYLISVFLGTIGGLVVMFFGDMWLGNSPDPYE